ncbi:helicase-related protein [Staphylospora marina]|uniref:helicase-related protein n=1 Tax=Staphylospora marina TaxID=2490858 RepID=UPI000F5BDFE8|nr:helicase-related protein [Staphylospora marina]
MFSWVKVAGKPGLRVSLAPETDGLWWKEQGKRIWIVGSVRSAESAFRRAAEDPSAPEGGEPPDADGIDLFGIRELAEDWSALLAGRRLLPEELKAVLATGSRDVPKRTVRRVLQWMILEGMCRMEPAVTKGPDGTALCRRCGSRTRIVESFCAWCGDRCLLCEECLLLGRARSCLPLFEFAVHRAHPAVAVSAAFSGPPLTPAQAGAASRLEELVEGGQRRILFHAVTGAGKTETLMPLILRMLREGRQVLWVTPRKDVVTELAPRFRAVFPGTEVRALCGGTGEWRLDGSLFVATAHQTLRFAGKFDLAVADEADAFPLYGNEALEASVLRSLRPGAPLILLTATPPAGWKSLARQGRLSVVELPVRYHGLPLPEPKLVRFRGLRRRIHDLRPVPPLSAWLREVEHTDGQAFLFVPVVEDVPAMLRWLKEHEPDWGLSAGGVFSRDRGRDEKIAKFREGSLRLLVTTTILERGVTVPRAHVMVIGADHPVFGREALVQMAGRVGRSPEYRAGTVVFLGEESTRSQVLARNEIRRLNDRAREEGIAEERTYKH